MNDTINIREYEAKDKQRLIVCMETFQDYLVGLDSLHLMQRPPEYGAEYTRLLLERIEKQNGRIFVAEKQGKIVGLVAGIIQEQGEKQKVEDIPYLEGNILELYVEESLRGQGIGTQLIQTMETYFLSQNCTVLSIGVMSDNALAHKLYQKMGYHDREIYMVKNV